MPPEFKQAAADAWLTGVQVGVLQDRTGKLMVRVTSSTSFEVYLVKPEKPPQKAPAETIAEFYLKTNGCGTHYPGGPGRL